MHKRRRLLNDLAESRRKRLEQAGRVVTRFLKSVRRPINTRDPISLNALGDHGPYFVLVEGACVFIMEISGLQNLVNTTGKLFNPVTNQNLDELQKKRLCRVAQARGCPFQFNAWEMSNDENQVLCDALLQQFGQLFEEAQSHELPDDIEPLLELAATIVRLNANGYVQVFDIMRSYGLNMIRGWTNEQFTHSKIRIFTIFMAAVSITMQAGLSDEDNVRRDAMECDIKLEMLVAWENHDKAIRRERRRMRRRLRRTPATSTETPAVTPTVTSTVMLSESVPSADSVHYAQ